MKKYFIAFISMMILAFGPMMSAKEAGQDKITRIEPPCWWTGMKTSLQLMIQGPSISEYSVEFKSKDLKVISVHKADNPNFLFVDVEVSPDAKGGYYDILFSKGREKFTHRYHIGHKSTEPRESFSTKDVIYLIVPDRFANGDPSNDSTEATTEKANRENPGSRHGGDIRGIINHMDYISDLGATAIWMTPLLEDNARRGSYHGYACTDYYNIDSRFGNNDEYREMVQVAHAKGVKVIMDIVTNHCGSEHWWMKDMPFNDWIHINEPYVNSNHMYSLALDPNASTADRKLMEEGWFSRGMPDMNLDNPFMLKYFQQWAVWWIEFSGLDGFRVDTYFYNEKYPMSQWCKAVTDEYPGFNIVGENWNANPDMVAYWQKDNPNPDGFNSNLPCLMDFPLRDAVNNALSLPLPSELAEPAEPQSQRGQRRGPDMTSVYNVLARDFQYHDLANMMIFWSNHDTPRIGDIFGQNYDKMKISFAMLATMRGIPQMFYGDELMFAIGKKGRDDSRLRMDFPGGWEGDQMDLFTEEGRKAASSVEGWTGAAELHDYVRTLLNWRKGKSVIHNGKTMHFIPIDNTYAYFRYDDNDVVFVFVNNSEKAASVNWSRYAEINSGLGEGRNVLTGERTTLTDDTMVPANSALIVEYSR